LRPPDPSQPKRKMLLATHFQRGKAMLDSLYFSRITSRQQRVKILWIGYLMKCSLWGEVHQHLFVGPDQIENVVQCALASYVPKHPPALCLGGHSKVLGGIVHKVLPR